MTAAMRRGATWRSNTAGQREIMEPTHSYTWVAIDRRTRKSLLRLRDLYQLGDVCERLDWKVIDASRGVGARSRGVRVLAPTRNVIG
jgi:hypothetical protein